MAIVDIVLVLSLNDQAPEVVLLQTFPEPGVESEEVDHFFQGEEEQK